MISPLSSDCLAACVWKCWNGLYFSTKKASVLLKGQKLNIILTYSGIKRTLYTASHLYTEFFIHYYLAD